MVLNVLQQHEVLRSEILIMVNVKIIVFWDVYIFSCWKWSVHYIWNDVCKITVFCSLTHIQTFMRNLLKMEAAYSFRMLVIYQTTQQHIPEDCNLAEIISKVMHITLLIQEYRFI
jgi:hypothetical protein